MQKGQLRWFVHFSHFITSLSLMLSPSTPFPSAQVSTCLDKFCWQNSSQFTIYHLCFHLVLSSPVYSYWIPALVTSCNSLILLVMYSGKHVRRRA
ncbi:hypothetical protein C8R41DRAFT_815091 [Lentinula lateritia]|uniref:Secreted protein n=1 Tax=Lentinula lateritia TaxID=40482 RepID=A0ABQ8VSC6_9AGAR|nr:hypothetical protein C8R41DRAFT_815091 [Lentinula lateritia]